MQKLDRGAVELFWCWGDSYQSQCNVTLLLIILHLFLCLSGLPHAVWGFAEPGVLDPLAFKFAPTMVSPAWMSHSGGCQQEQRCRTAGRGSWGNRNARLSRVCSGSQPLPGGTLHRGPLPSLGLWSSAARVSFRPPQCLLSLPGLDHGWCRSTQTAACPRPAPLSCLFLHSVLSETHC